MYAPRIVLIESDAATHRALRKRLELRGCRVFTVHSQPEAVERAAHLHADLVVQEDPAHSPGELDEIVSAVEILAGPLPA
jgi:ActR/RegA family two-component response regulator